MLWVWTESNASFKRLWGQGSFGSDFHGDERGPLLLLLQDVGPPRWSLGLESPPCFWFLAEHIQRLEQEPLTPFCA